MSANRVRWQVLRTLIAAVRAAVRPGGPGLAERLKALPRLVRATVRGEYRGTSAGSLGLMVAAVLYVLSPVDLVPEGLFALVGLADDAVVVGWLAAAVITATEDFLAWERGVRSPTDSTSAYGAPGAAGAPAAGPTIRGTVVG